MTEAAQQPNQNSTELLNQAGIQNKVIPKKTVYMRNREMVEFEKELETSRLAKENAVTEQPSNPANEHENPNSLNEPQNVDWQKRYSDLQSHADKKVADAKRKADEETQKRIDAENRLKETLKAGPKYPTSEEELAQWCKEFPPLLPIIQTIALKATEGQNAELYEEMKKLKEVTQNYVNEKGRTELLKIHPDANEIEADPRFAQWFSEQEPEIQALIPETGGIPKKIAKAISLYKKDMGIVTKTAQDLQKEASKFVNLGPSQPNLPKEQKTWYESEVQRMTQKQYATFEHDIEIARSEGRYIRDVTGAS